MRRVLAAAALAVVSLASIPASAANPNGSGGDMPAYYDANLFTINFKELSSKAEMSLLRSNHSINIIYMSDQAEAAGVMFTSVLDAIQADGFNPLWQEVQIVFDTIPPQQFTSDTDVLAAAAAGQITLIPTTEVYRCAVVGTKK
jgi:hypothetical protein